MAKEIQFTNLSERRSPLRLSFVPLTDCAPLVMAHELGLFWKYGINVTLSRELGWASIRDKIIYGELEAAHAVAGMPVAATLGLGSIRCECLTAMVLNLHGNGITLSNELWRRGVRDGASLREEVVRSRHERTMIFGAVYPFSSHYFLLCNWLTASGIRPNRDVRVVIVPPPQMVANLKAGNLDGFCVGEPWNSLAVQTNAGWCVGASAELDPRHPEKVLMVRREFAERREEEHLALVAALLDACEFCDAPENHDRIVTTLARPEYVNVPAKVLRPGFTGHFDFGRGRVRKVSDLLVFYRNHANEPAGDKAAWVLQRMRASERRLEPAALNFALGRRVFRTDLFDKALCLRDSVARVSQDEPDRQSVTPGNAPAIKLKTNFRRHSFAHGTNPHLLITKLNYGLH